MGHSVGITGVLKTGDEPPRFQALELFLQGWQDHVVTIVLLVGQQKNRPGVNNGLKAIERERERRQKDHGYELSPCCFNTEMNLIEALKFCRVVVVVVDCE